MQDRQGVRQFLSASHKDWATSRRALRLINSFFLGEKIQRGLAGQCEQGRARTIRRPSLFTCPTLYFADRLASRANHHSSYYFTKGIDELPLRFANRFTGSKIGLGKRILHTWGHFIRTGCFPLSLLSNSFVVWTTISGEWNCLATWSQVDTESS